MQRVMIVGGPGSGKSTLAQWLGEACGLPVYHMDHIHHLPGWEPRPMAEKHAMAHAIEAQEAWVFEGGMSSAYDTRATRADTLIWLDLPVGLRLWRVTRRLWRHYGQTRPDMADGCIETVGPHTWEFYVWIWTTRQSQRQKIVELVARHGDALTVHHLKNRRAVAAFMAKIDRAPAST